MHDARWSHLKDVLIERGWVWRDNTLYAPHETMWFDTRADDPEFALFHDRMTAPAGAVDQVALHEDLITLVSALDVVLGN